MKKKAYLMAVTGLLAAFGVIGGAIGIVETAEAGPKISDGMANRFFQVQVKQRGAGGAPGPNCYSFLADNDDDQNGMWIDPLWLLPPNGPGLLPGIWQDEDGNGAITHYTASATAFEGVLLLQQTGKVTPSFSNGQTRLTAFTTLFIFDSDVLGYVETGLEFVSTGYEVDSCD